MRIITFLSILILGIINIECTELETKNTIQKQTSENSKVKHIMLPKFQTIVDSLDLKGCILILDNSANTYYSNNFNWASKGQLPASTFKIPNSIISLELGLIKDTSTILLWDGQPQMNSNWEQDLILKDAFQLSCVPCYRQLARQIGLDRMTTFLTHFNYGQMVIDSSNLDLFWLLGDSKISPFQEISFLKRFNQQNLDIKPSTYYTMKQILLREHTDNYQLFGKTGWSNDKNHDNTWFVGFLEHNDHTYYFATNLEPTINTDINKMAFNRIIATKLAFIDLGINISIE